MDYNILRENDIRGEYPTQINGEVGIKVAQAFAVYLTNLGVKKCMLGHDNRVSSEEIYKAILKALLSSGIDVVSIGLVLNVSNFPQRFLIHYQMLYYEKL